MPDTRNRTEEMLIDHDSRMIEIESKMAFMEDLLQTLNDMVAKQSDELSRLWSANQLLKKQLETVHQGIKSHDEEAPPPHY